MRKVTALLLAAACASCTGTKEPQMSTPPTPTIHIRILNEGNARLEDAYVQAGSFRTVRRSLSKGQATTHLFFDHPLGSQIAVHLTYPDGSYFLRHVPVPAAVRDASAKAEFTLLLTVDSDTQQVALEVIDEGK